MKGFSSFGMFEMILDGANEKFAPSFKPDDGRLKILKEYCSVIDDLIESSTDFENEQQAAFGVEVNEYDMTVHFTIGVPEIVDENPGDSKLVKLIQRAVSMKIEIADADTIALHLVFPSVWVRS